MAEERGFKIPSVKELIEMIDSMSDISEEEKKMMKEEILGKGSGPEKSSPGPVGGSTTPEVIWVACLFLVVAAVIGGIAVKLIYREWERTREPGKKKKKSSEKAIVSKRKDRKGK